MMVLLLLRAFDRFDEIKVRYTDFQNMDSLFDKPTTAWSIWILASHASRLQIDGLTVQLAI